MILLGDGFTGLHRPTSAYIVLYRPRRPTSAYTGLHRPTSAYMGPNTINRNQTLVQHFHLCQDFIALTCPTSLDECVLFVLEMICFT